MFEVEAWCRYNKTCKIAALFKQALSENFTKHDWLPCTLFKATPTDPHFPTY